MAAMTMTSTLWSVQSMLDLDNKILTDVLVIVKHLLDLVTNLAIGELDVILGVAAVVHKREEVVVGDIELGCSQYMKPSARHLDLRAGIHDG